MNQIGRQIRRPARKFLSPGPFSSIFLLSNFLAVADNLCCYATLIPQGALALTRFFRPDLLLLAKIAHRQGFKAMYTPTSFKEERLEVLHRLMRSNPLGLLVSNGENGPLATALPHLIVDGSSFGTLQCHLARANPHWQALDKQNVLIVFQGPDEYISPKWYPSKEEDGKVVPTWNYAMVQARGLAQVIDDATWLKRQITSLTNQQEATAVNPWKVSDAPGDYIDAQLKGIIGLEIKITALEGKWKVSQNRSLKDRSGVAENLSAQGKDEMAQLVRDYGGLDSANS
jgi:transcriptional regulator